MIRGWRVRHPVEEFNLSTFTTIPLMEIFTHPNVLCAGVCLQETERFSVQSLTRFLMSHTMTLWTQVSNASCGKTCQSNTLIRCDCKLEDHWSRETEALG